MAAQLLRYASLTLHLACLSVELSLNVVIVHYIVRMRRIAATYTERQKFMMNTEMVSKLSANQPAASNQPNEVIEWLLRCLFPSLAR